MEQITSRKNPLLMKIRRLASGGSRDRREAGEFLGDGTKLLEEALKWGADLTAVAVSDGVDLPELPAGLDRDSMTPEFDEPPVYDAANSAGRFYYVAYSSDSLTERTLLRALGGGITTVLTYTEPKPDGEFETACLRRLREVKADA